MKRRWQLMVLFVVLLVVVMVLARNKGTGSGSAVPKPVQWVIERFEVQDKETPRPRLFIWFREESSTDAGEPRVFMKGQGLVVKVSEWERKVWFLYALDDGWSTPYRCDSAEDFRKAVTAAKAITLDVTAQSEYVLRL